MFFNKKFILASNSNSRAFILKNNKLNFRQISPACDEELLKKQKNNKNMSPSKLSLMLAKAKARSISKKVKGVLVVGSDTTIEFNGKIIDKVKSIEDAKKKLLKMSGKKHKIYSSAAVYYNNKLAWKKTQKSTVKIRKMSPKEITFYLSQSGKNILDSVGCYQIEKNGPNIIENISGDFFNIMGFPLFPFLSFLKEHKP